MDETLNPQRRYPAAPHALSTLEREQLFIANHASLRDAAFDAYPAISFIEVDNILRRLSHRLWRFIAFDGDDFLRLAEQYTRNWAWHQGLYFHLVSTPDNVKVVYAAIRDSLYKSVLDCSTDADDIFGEIAAYLYTHLNGFVTGPQKAKTTTRLYALTKKHVFFYHNKPRLSNHRSVERRMRTHDNFRGAETFSPLELAEMSETELQAAAA